jgi:ABC-type multidrug transport system ATPase subunit
VVAVQVGTRVALLAQQPRPEPDSTLREVALAGAARNRGLSGPYEQELAAEQMLARLGVDEVDALVRQASGGRRRRAAADRLGTPDLQPRPARDAGVDESPADP